MMRMHHIFRNRTSGQVLFPILLAFLLALPATAQLVPLGPQFQVDQGTSFFQNCPKVAGRGDRGFTVAWATESSIEARVFHGPTQTLLGPTIDVDEGRMEGRSLAELTVQNRPGRGDLVFWSSNLGTPSSKRFDARQVFPFPDNQIRLRPPAYVTRVSPRRTGDYVGAWVSNRGIWSLTALNFYGRAVGPSVRVNQTPSEGTFLDVVHAADGSLTVFWFTPSPSGRLLLRRFGADLRPLGPEVALADEGNFSGVRAASAPDGRTAFTWVDYELLSGVAGTLYVRFFERDGTPASALQAVFTVPTDEGGNSFHPEAIAVDRLGRALIVWNQLDQERAIQDYRVQLWSLAGPLSEAMDVGEDVRTGTPFCADAAAAGRTWVVAFRAARPDNGIDAIWARRFFSTD